MKVDLARIQRGLARRVSKVVPLRCTTTEKLAAKNPACWTEIFPAETVVWPASLPSGALPQGFVDRFTLRHEAKGMLRLEQGFVVSDDGWVFTRGGWRVFNLSQFGTLVEHAPRTRLPFPRWKATKLPGTTLTLLSMWGACNFYHFLLDVLPKLELFRRFGMEWSAVDHILLPLLHSPTADRMVRLLQLPAEKIVWVERDEPFFVQAGQLLCPSFPNGHRTVSRWAVEFLRGVRRLPPTAGGRQLFVPRRGRNRFLRNEDEIWRQLEAHGFERFDPGQDPDAEAAFHAAAVVVGVHGAALANLVFCRPGTRVLELLPSDHCYPHYLSLSTSASLRYDCLVGRSEHHAPRHPLSTYTSSFDFEIHPEIFAKQLAALLTG